jgi:hypothetical protein
MLHLKVIGNSPLRALEAKLIYAVVPGRSRVPNGFDREPDLPEQPNYGEPLDLTANPSMGRVHMPGDEMTVEITLENLFLTADHATALDKGDSFLCVYGFVRYRDSSVSWKRRETRFCLACGNWGPTGRKIADGYWVAGPSRYNEVTEFPWSKRVWNRIMRYYRKNKQQPQKAN